MTWENGSAGAEGLLEWAEDVEEWLARSLPS